MTRGSLFGTQEWERTGGCRVSTLLHPKTRVVFEGGAAGVCVLGRGGGGMDNPKKPLWCCSST